MHGLNIKGNKADLIAALRIHMKHGGSIRGALKSRQEADDARMQYTALANWVPGQAAVGDEGNRTRFTTGRCRKFK